MSSTITMKPEVKKLWTDALRSGEYTQGHGRLGRVEDDGSVTYCCLGVLCEVALKAGLKLDVRTGEHAIEYQRETATLPASVQRWAGLSDDYCHEGSNPSIRLSEPVSDSDQPGGGNRRFTAALAELNDGAYGYDGNGEPFPHWSFEQIAAVIDEQL